MKDKASKKRDYLLLVIVVLTLFIALFSAVLLFNVKDMQKQQREELQQEIARLEQEENHVVTIGGEEKETEEAISEEVPEASQIETETYTCIARREARCYQYPDTASAVLAKIKNGDKIEVGGEEENRFYLCVLDDGTVAYVERKYLNKDGAYAHVPGAVDLREFLPNAEFELLFASPDNITGHAMYPAIPLLEENTAYMLLEAAQIFERDGYAIKIYDAYRPKSAQFELYDIVQDNRFIANPYNCNSWHQLGRAVDMSLINMRTGEELEMPTPMHTFDVSASRFNSRTWTEAAKANVDYMTSVMTSVGFGTLSTEWWHFENTGTGGYLDPNMDLTDPAYLG